MVSACIFQAGQSRIPYLCRLHLLRLLQAMKDLDWRPEYSLIDGLTDSYQKDFGRGTFRKEPDFSVDDKVLAQFK